MNNLEVLLRSQAEESLRAGCERNFEYLRELRLVHLQIDSLTSEIESSELATVLRLRKVFLHVQAVTSWRLRTYTHHEVAPDIRAAMEQLKPIVRERLDRKEPAQIRDRVLKRLDRTMTNLDSFLHPTPATLIYPIRDGGLQRAEAVDALVILNLWLMELLSYYGIGLETIATILDPTKVASIRSITKQAKDDLKELLSLPYLTNGGIAFEA